jgi:hypothetical protein
VDDSEDRPVNLGSIAGLISGALSLCDGKPALKVNLILSRPLEARAISYLKPSREPFHFAQGCRFHHDVPSYA